MKDFWQWFEALDHNLVTVVSIFSSVGFFAALVMKWVQSQIDKVFIQLAKNFLIRTLGEIENGKKLSEIELLGLKEIYGLYIKKGGNTYIKDKYEALKAQGLI